MSDYIPTPCPDCGGIHEHEGECPDVDEFLANLAEIDHWNSLTEKEREDRIKTALRGF